MARKLRTETDRRINRAIIGYSIPVLSIVEIYGALENAVKAGATDDELRETVASFGHLGVVESGVR